MTIRVKLFALLRERAGASETSVDVPDGATVAFAATALAAKFPAVSGHLSRVAFAVNQSYVDRETVLRDGDELAIIPPVSGGCGEMDLLRIQDEPIHVGDAVRFVADPRAGGIDVFLGTTRSEKHADGRDLVALDYEAYGEMASKQLRELAAGARQRWPIVKLAIVHRTGRVALAEPSVVIAVSCPHRGEAFDACRWIIDTLKKDVAIWKKEVWSDGRGTWVHPSGPLSP